MQLVQFQILALAIAQIDSSKCLSLDYNSALNPQSRRSGESVWAISND